MKLYMHPASTACRPVMLFAAEILVEKEMVAILSRAHHHEQSLKEKEFVRI
jgi:glutathione S-transferase